MIRSLLAALLLSAAVPAVAAEPAATPKETAATPVTEAAKPAANAAAAKLLEAPKPSHGLVLYGELKYGPDFKHLDYVNPDAPKGGELKLAQLSSFDSLNLFILNGVKATGMTMVMESLMTSSLDEPQSYYGLIAETVTLDPARQWMEFKLRKEAQWHDKSQITPEDVVFSFYTIRDKGDPTYKMLYAGVKEAKVTGPDTVRFEFEPTAARDLPLLIASLPIISKAYYSTHDFEKTTLESPLGSGPYKVKSVNQGRSIVFERVKDYWGANLPINIGQNNFDTIRYDVYTDETVGLEALKAGEYDFREEYVARNWATAYNNVRSTPERPFVKKMIPHNIPQGMQAFVFNQRKAKFRDRRVREAIDLTLDFEWINRTLFYKAYLRNKSFFENTAFAATGVPVGAELELLTPFKDQLPPAMFATEYQPPMTDGSGNARENLLKAQQLLNDAGWVIKDGKRVHRDTGEVFEIEFLLRQPTFERIVAPMRKNLRKLGITATIRSIDDSQYQKRLDEGDFDIVTLWINKGLFFPGNEQMTYWHSSQADVKGGNNLAGMKHPAVDAMLEKIGKATTLEELTPAAMALDRILLWEHAVIPNWHVGGFRVAYWDKFGQPKIAPIYGLGIMSWWAK